MKKAIRSFVVLAVVFGMNLPGLASAAYESEAPESVVNSITLQGTGADIKWSVDGYSASGFKVVWSKNDSPVYPNREGDRYHYYSEPSKRSDRLEAFSGNGSYYVRVCEYLGGKCGKYSNQIKVEIGEAVACTMEYAPVCGKNGKTYSNKCIAKSEGVTEIKYSGECNGDDDSAYKKSLEEKKALETAKRKAEDDKMIGSAKALSNDQYQQILNELKELRNLVKEQQAELKYLRSLRADVGALSEKMESALNKFIAYGADDNTKKLGEGERAAVIYSYKSAFGKLPEDESDLTDAIKIANGRWPSEKSESAENDAKETFAVIYDRNPDTKNPQDNAAVTVMAYGLRQKAENRSLKKEAAAIKIFKGIFGRSPKNTEDWNVVQAIAYSGARR